MKKLVFIISCVLCTTAVSNALEDVVLKNPLTPRSTIVYVHSSSSDLDHRVQYVRDRLTREEEYILVFDIHDISLDGLIRRIHTYERRMQIIEIRIKILRLFHEMRANEFNRVHAFEV